MPLKRPDFAWSCFLLRNPLVESKDTAYQKTKPTEASSNTARMPRRIAAPGSDDMRGWGAPGWYINGHHRAPQRLYFTVEARSRDYVPFQSIFDTSGCYAYNPRERAYPRLPAHGARGMTESEDWGWRRPRGAGQYQQYDFQMRDMPYYGHFQPGQ